MCFTDTTFGPTPNNVIQNDSEACLGVTLAGGRGELVNERGFFLGRDVLELSWENVVFEGMALETLDCKLIRIMHCKEMWGWGWGEVSANCCNAVWQL